VTLCGCRGMWWRRSWLSLNGKAEGDPKVRREGVSYAGPVQIANGGSMHHAGVPACCCAAWRSACWAC